MEDSRRNLIFISHATPEDNIFTLWLSTRLKLLGYEVWSDVTQLFGGEKWWDDIEEAIDRHTCKFIIVVTSTSLSKSGVQRELEIALKVEKEYQLQNFIVPVIIDDSQFGSQPYGLSERNIIPFSSGWGAALARLLERFEKDFVPKKSSCDDIGEHLTSLLNPSHVLSLQEDIVASNWLSVSKTPTHLNLFRLPEDVKMWRIWCSECPYPWFEWNGMLVTFSEADDLNAYLPEHVVVSSAARMELDAVIYARPRNHAAFARTEVIKQMNYLLRKGWNSTMKLRGMCRYELASGKEAWFFPDSEATAGRQKFADIHGQARSKQILGFSAKNKVYWHFAIEAKSQYGAFPKICLIPHVVFTEDGKTPLDNKAKMHSMRRGFCKSWWNDRWRDMMLVYLNLVSAGEKDIEVVFGKNVSVKFSSRPQFGSTKYSLVSSALEEKVAPDIEDVKVDFEGSESADGK